MTDPAGDASEQDLDAAIADVCRGSLEGFVAKRDALAKELRAAGRRDDAGTVKSLRKPSRPAWALDAVALEDPAAVEGLAEALAEAIEAQTTGGDLRAAFDHLRERVRSVAAAAADTARAEGHPVDQAGLVPALSAVVADTEAFEALRAGRLTAIPTGGGVDLLASLPQIAPRSPRASRTTRSSTSPGPGTGPPSDTVSAGAEAEPTDVESVAQAEAAAPAHRTLLEAETAVKLARERAAEAERALQKAEINAEVADEQLRVAERTARAKRRELDEARQEAEAAKARKHEAEEAAAQARADVDRQTS